MKNLETIIGKEYRVIEFSSAERFTGKDLLSGELFLSITGSDNSKDDRSVYLPPESFTRAIKHNSTDLIVLSCAGWRELKALQNTAEASLFFERITPFNFIFLIYFLAKGVVAGHQKYIGLFFSKRGKNIAVYLGIKRKKVNDKTARRYLSPLVDLEVFFRDLNSKKINYCILRWFEHLPEIEEDEDVDMMVDDEDLGIVYSTIERRPGIVPFDIYSKSGMPGSDFRELPYYTASLADKTLRETILYKNTYKVPTWENYFLLLAYHSIFHKGENSGLNSRKYDLSVTNKPDHDYRTHLKRILSGTNLCIKDLTLEGLHAFLDAQGYAPPLDTQYKLSIHNRYLKASLDDYHSQSDLLEKYKGLVCFVAREKILEAGLLDELKKFILKSGSTILRTVTIEDSFKDVFANRYGEGIGGEVRGPPAAGSPPSCWWLCVFVRSKPEPGDHRRHPGLSNRRIQNKNEIRDFINDKFPNKKDWFNGVHSSDNEIQAVEYLSLAGLDKEEIHKEISRQMEIFATEYPVIEVMSRYSKRAKVELILYNGKKAVKKNIQTGV